MSHQQVSLGPLVPLSFGTVSSMPCKLRWRWGAAGGTSAFMSAVSLAQMQWMLSSVTWCKTLCFAPVRCLDWKPLDSAKLWWRPKCLNRLARNCFAETRKWPLRTAAAAFTVFWSIGVHPVLQWRTATVTQKTCHQRKKALGGRRAPGFLFDILHLTVTILHQTVTITLCT